MSETRQRWRLVVARGPTARDVPHRDVQAAFEAGLRLSGLDVSASEGARPRARIAFAAPVPVGMLAERELIDVALRERRLIHEVREAVAGALPNGYSLVDLYDVWSGWPALPGQVVAGDYRVAVTAAAERGPTAETLEAAIGALLAAPRLDARREKGGATITVDTRPHLIALRATSTPADGSFDRTFQLWMRLRLGGERGVGRPEEVVAALEARLGYELRASAFVRERILLQEDAPNG
jgi:radical SAM-linked protein